MKALEYLYRMRKSEEEVGNYDATNLYEAISELEALQQRSCEGCVHNNEDHWEIICDSCIRKLNDTDYYEAKGAMR